MMKKIISIFSLISFLLLAALPGQAQFNKGDKSKAKTEGLDLNTDSEISQLKRYLKLKDTKGIRGAALSVLSKDQKSVLALNALAITHYQAGRIGLARVILNRALKVDPKSPTLYNNLGLLDLADGDEKGALSYFRKSLSLKKSYDWAYLNIGSLFLEYLDYKKAKPALEEGLDQVKDGLKKGQRSSVEIANNYAVALAGLGKGKSAEKIFKKILDADVRDSSVLLNYAILLVDVLKEKKTAYKIISKLRFSTDNKKVLARANALEKRADKL